MASWALRLFGSICLLVIAVVAGLAGWSQAIALANPKMALRLYSGQASALLSEAERLRLSNKSQPGEMSKAARKLLRSAPLLDAPLVYLGLQLSAEGDVPGARKSFLSALKRQPRNIPALSWLAADAIGNNRLNAGADYLDRLALLNPGKSELYAGALASIAERKGGVGLLESRLARGSALAEKALNRLNGTSNDIPMLLALNARSNQQQDQLVARILSDHGVTAAFVAWVSLRPYVEASSFSWPIDPAFVGNNAPLPFNWQIFDGASMLEEGGLYVSYAGRKPQVFAQQVMMLTPGSYRVLADGSVTTSEEGGILEWVVECYSSETLLGAAKLEDGSKPSAREFSFDVPATKECLAQRMILRGRPGDFPDRMRATIRRVSIRLAGAAE